MQYRRLGRTGLQVSEIGMGCEGLTDHEGKYMKDFLDYAVQAGINYLDFYAPDPRMRRLLGEALLGRREKFVLQAHLCAVWKNGQYERTRNIKQVKESFAEMLQLLQTDFVDIGMVHYVDSLEDWQQVREGPVMRYALELKAAGKLHHIGLSSHNPVAAQAAVESGLIDVLMFSVNPCYDLQPPSEDCEDLWKAGSYAHELVNMDPARERLYETCQRLGVAITVMKAFGGGDLLQSKISPAGQALTVCQCLHYALTRPAVAVVLAGAHTLEELRAAAAYEEASPTERDYAAALAAFPKIRWQGHCMYCGHCAPCPQGIDVAMVTKLLNLVRAQGSIPETVREHYGLLAHPAGACIACGACETRCPFGVEIRKNMAEAAVLFGR